MFLAPSEWGAAGAPAGLRQWVGTVTQIIPPNYGVVDGDAYYINAVVVGQIPQARGGMVGEGPRKQQSCRAAAPCPATALNYRPCTLPAMQVGEKVRAEGVAHNEGSYKWRVTRLELESAAAAAASARTAPMPTAAPGGGGGGAGRFAPRSGAPLLVWWSW